MLSPLISGVYQLLLYLLVHILHSCIHTSYIHIYLLLYNNTVDLVILARFHFRELKNLAKIIIIALLKKNENQRILNFAKI